MTLEREDRGEGYVLPRSAYPQGGLSHQSGR
jgi:hypothetical protein